MKRQAWIAVLSLALGLAGRPGPVGAQGAPSIGSLKASVQALVPAKLSAANARLLTSLLDVAQLRLAQGRTSSAVVLLNAFVSSVNSMISSTPPALNGTDGGALVSQANSVISATLGTRTLISGTAARGVPISNAQITAKDRNGTVRTGSTDASGQYSLDVTGLSAPYLLKITAPTTPTPTDYYSVGVVSGVINISPFTDLIIRNYYSVRGLDVATVFATLNSSSPVPTASEIQILSSMVAGVLSQWLAAQGISSDGWSPITTPFAANGTGADAVLDQSTVTVTGPTTVTVVVQAGTVTQNSTFSSNPGSATVTANTTTTDSSSGATSSSQSSSIIPFATALQNAVAGVNATMSQFGGTINTKGLNLAASDLLPFFDPGYMDGGDNSTITADQEAGDFRGQSFPLLTVSQVNAFDSVNQIIDVLVSGGGKGLLMTYKLSGSSWLLYGNQAIASRKAVQVESRTDDSGTPVSSKHVNVDIRPLQGVVSTSVPAIVVTGGGVFSNTVVPFSGSTELDTLHPTPNPANDFTITRDAFFAGATFAAYPPPGTPFTVVVTPLSGSPTTTTILSGATTDETISASTSAGAGIHAIVAAAGHTLTVNWTLPTTFPIVEVKLGGYAQNGSLQEVNLNSPTNLTPTSTTGQVIIPAQVNGQPVTTSGININVKGAGGISILYIYFFQ